MTKDLIGSVEDIELKLREIKALIRVYDWSSAEVCSAQAQRALRYLAVALANLDDNDRDYDPNEVHPSA
jgi:hypothetical protein